MRGRGDQLQRDPGRHADGTLRAGARRPALRARHRPAGRPSLTRSPARAPTGASWAGATRPSTGRRGTRCTTGADEAQRPTLPRDHRGETAQEQLPLIPVAWYRMNAAVSDRVDGFVMDPLETTWRITESPSGPREPHAGRPWPPWRRSPGLAQAVGVAVLVSVLCFFVVHRLPGDARLPHRRRALRLRPRRRRRPRPPVRAELRSRPAGLATAGLVAGRPAPARLRPLAGHLPAGDRGGRLLPARDAAAGSGGSRLSPLLLGVPCSASWPPAGPAGSSTG